MSILKRAESRELVQQIVAKSKKVKKAEPALRRGGNLITKINNIREQVQKRLGHYKEQLCLIRTEQELHDYIDAAIQNKIIAIDTETTGLDPITDQIVGACIYTYGQKPAYIPINHISYITNLRLDDQLTNEQVRKEFQRLVDEKTKCIFFNAKFDIRVMRHQLNVYIEPAWCGFIASKCLKENELEGNLKYLWKKYCSQNKDEAHFTFDKMFEGIKFNLIPIDTAYLYAAKDALMTLDLYDFQLPYLTETDEKCINADLTRVAKLYREIELPIISIVADIEDYGVAIDVDYAKELSVKYHKQLDEKLDAFYKALAPYQQQIDQYIASNPDTKLENPINISSPVQLAELFYDVLKVGQISKKAPRGTGEEVLEKMGHSLCKPILDYRGVSKLLTTYIDKMPQIVNNKTGRIHCSFNQYGADTGRFSCIAKGTKISMPEGNKNIEDVQSGDEVYTYTENNQIILKKVKNSWRTGIKHCIKLYWKAGNKISGYLICTPDHYIKTTQGWIQAQNLDITYNIYSNKLKEDHTVSIYKIEQLEELYEVYDLEIEGTHNFIANELCVHNSSNPNMQNIPSHNLDIRRMFISSRDKEIELQNNVFNLLIEDIVLTTQGEKKSQNLVIGDILVCDDGNKTIKNIIKQDKQVLIEV